MGPGHQLLYQNGVSFIKQDNRARPFRLLFPSKSTAMTSTTVPFARPRIQTKELYDVDEKRLGRFIVNMEECAYIKDHYMFMYRKRRGKLVFTGFVRLGENILWVGRDERLSQPRFIDKMVPEDAGFFMKRMKRYDS